MAWCNNCTYLDRFSALMKQRISAGATAASSHVRVYGRRNTRNSLTTASDQNSYNSTLISSSANSNAARAASETLNGSYLPAVQSSNENTSSTQAQLKENIIQHTVYTTRSNSQTASSTAMQRNNNNSGK